MIQGTGKEHLNEAHGKIQKLQELRKILNVPKGIRIAQHIYNQCRDYEDSMHAEIVHDGKFFERDVRGIDIFYVSDEEL